VAGSRFESGKTDGRGAGWPKVRRESLAVGHHQPRKESTFVLEKKNTEGQQGREERNNGQLAGATTRRGFLTGSAKLLGGGALALALGGGTALAHEQAAQATASPGCAESVQDIISIAAIAEALATTFYYNGVTRRVGRRLDKDDLVYFKAALAQEKDHLDLLVGSGAAAPPSTFYFEKGTFSGVEKFTTVLLALETAFIGAYAAAIERFCELDRGDLAKLASRILGVEAEHRALGRDVAGFRVPNNLCLERAPFTCVSEAADALAPFLSAGSGKIGFEMPTDAQIEAKSIPCED